MMPVQRLTGYAGTTSRECRFNDRHDASTTTGVGRIDYRGMPVQRPGSAGSKMVMMPVQRPG
jgi:hypothetical protein